MVKEFEYPEQKMDNSGHTLTPHHEQSTASQVRFTSHVQSLAFTMKEPGNPFKEENTDLISLVSEDIADPAIKASLNKIGGFWEGSVRSFNQRKARGEI